MLKDVVGKDLTIGDTVVMLQTNAYSASLELGVVIGFTPKMIRIERTEKNRWDPDLCLRAPERVVKV